MKNVKTTQRKNMRKILSAVVAVCFLFNTIISDYALALSPKITSGESSSPVKDDMYAAGLKLFAAKKGPGSRLSADIEESMKGVFIGKEPKIDGLEIMGGEDELPDEWANNPILSKTDLKEAFEYFRDHEAKIPANKLKIIEGYFPVRLGRGELPIARLEKNKDGTCTLVLHTKFIQMWNHIRANDVWVYDRVQDRVLSLAWGIFYRVAKHEMADIENMFPMPKGGGHLLQSKNTAIVAETNEFEANEIGGRWSIVSDGFWMWFLGSYCFSNATRYNQATLEKRLRWFFSSKEEHKLWEEFPNLYHRNLNRDYKKTEREFAIKLALAVNYKFFKNRPKAKVPEFGVDQKYLQEANMREGNIESVLPATGEDEGDQQEDPQELPPGKKINDRYEIKEKLGEGGFGIVYLASDLNLSGKLVVIKQLRPEIMSDPEMVRRLNREIELTVSLRSPYIIELTDKLPESPEATKNTRFLIFKVAQGMTLAKWMRQLSFQEKLRVAVEILKGLDAMHREGIIHRDIKPDNIMVYLNRRTGELNITIIDLGLAKNVGKAAPHEAAFSRDAVFTTQQGTAMGTPAYMSPEQASGDIDGLTTATDVYSFGSMFYQMLTGRIAINPDNAKLTPMQMMYRHVDPTVNIKKPSELNPEILAVPGLDEVIMKALSRNPADRFQNAGQLKDAMTGVKEQPAAETLKLGAQAAKKPSNKLAVIGAATAAAVVVGGGAYLLMNKPAPETPPAPPEIKAPAAAAAMPAAPVMEKTVATTPAGRITAKPLIKVNPDGTPEVFDIVGDVKMVRCEAKDLPADIPAGAKNKPFYLRLTPKEVNTDGHGGQASFGVNHPNAPVNLASGQTKFKITFWARKAPGSDDNAKPYVGCVFYTDGYSWRPNGTERRVKKTVQLDSKEWKRIELDYSFLPKNTGLFHIAPFVSPSAATAVDIIYPAIEIPQVVAPSAPIAITEPVSILSIDTLSPSGKGPELINTIYNRKPGVEVSLETLSRSGRRPRDPRSGEAVKGPMIYVKSPSSADSSTGPTRAYLTVKDISPAVKLTPGVTYKVRCLVCPLTIEDPTIAVCPNFVVNGVNKTLSPNIKLPINTKPGEWFIMEFFFIAPGGNFNPTDNMRIWFHQGQYLMNSGMTIEPVASSEEIPRGDVRITKTIDFPEPAAATLPLTAPSPAVMKPEAKKSTLLPLLPLVRRGSRRKETKQKPPVGTKYGGEADQEATKALAATGKDSGGMSAGKKLSHGALVLFAKKETAQALVTYLKLRFNDIGDKAETELDTVRSVLKINRRFVLKYRKFERLWARAQRAGISKTGSAAPAVTVALPAVPYSTVTPLTETGGLNGTIDRNIIKEVRERAVSNMMKNPSVRKYLLTASGVTDLASLSPDDRRRINDYFDDLPDADVPVMSQELSRQEIADIRAQAQDDVEEQKRMARDTLDEALKVLRDNDQRGLADKLDGLYDRILPYIVKGQDESPIHHVAYVMKFASKILVSERKKGKITDDDIAIVMIAALFHDSGIGYQTVRKIVESDFKDLPPETASRLMDKAILSRNQHMTKGAEVFDLFSENIRMDFSLSAGSIAKIRKIVNGHDNAKIPLLQVIVNELNGKPEAGFDEGLLIQTPADNTTEPGNNDNIDWLMQIHLEADMLWMVSKDGVDVDIERAIRNRKKPMSIPDQLRHNVAQHRKTVGLVYDKAKTIRSSDYKFRDGYIYRSGEGYNIFIGESAATQMKSAVSPDAIAARRSEMMRRFEDIQIQPDVSQMLKRLAARYNLAYEGDEHSGALKILEAIRRADSRISNRREAIDILIAIGVSSDMAGALYTQLAGLRVLAMDGTSVSSGMPKPFEGKTLRQYTGERAYAAMTAPETMGSAQSQFQDNPASISKIMNMFKMLKENSAETAPLVEAIKTISIDIIDGEIGNLKPYWDDLPRTRNHRTHLRMLIQRPEIYKTVAGRNGLSLSDEELFVVRWVSMQMYIFGDLYFKMLPGDPENSETAPVECVRNALCAFRDYFMQAPQSKPSVDMELDEKQITSTPARAIVNIGGTKQVLLSIKPTEGKTLEEQATNAFKSIDDILAENGLTRDMVVTQSVFLRNEGDKKQMRELIGEFYGRSPPATGYIMQPPAEEGQLFAIEVTALKGRSVRNAMNIRKMNENVTVVKEGGTAWVYVAGIEPAPGIEDTYEQALSAIHRMKEAVEEAGLDFSDVVRTWLYQRHIVAKEDDNDRYDKLNRARNEVFKKEGPQNGPIQFGARHFRQYSPDNILPPASTGIGMSAGTFSMACLAMASGDPQTQIIPIENPTQDSVWKYKVEKGRPLPLFSRGMAVLANNRNLVLISGTASVKGSEIVYEGDLENQTAATIENIGLVLGQVGATVSDVPQIRIYIKPDKSGSKEADRANYLKVRSIVDTVFPDTAKIYLMGDVYRDGWLVEIEAVAFLPISGDKASIVAEPRLDGIPVEEEERHTPLAYAKELNAMAYAERTSSKARAIALSSTLRNPNFFPKIKTDLDWLASPDEKSEEARTIALAALLTTGEAHAKDALVKIADYEKSSLEARAIALAALFANGERSAREELISISIYDKAPQEARAIALANLLLSGYDDKAVADLKAITEYEGSSLEAKAIAFSALLTRGDEGARQELMNIVDYSQCPYPAKAIALDALLSDSLKTKPSVDMEFGSQDTYPFLSRFPASTAGYLDAIIAAVDQINKTGKLKAALRNNDPDLVIALEAPGQAQKPRDIRIVCAPVEREGGTGYYFRLGYNDGDKAVSMYPMTPSELTRNILELFTASSYLVSAPEILTLDILKEMVNSQHIGPMVRRLSLPPAEFEQSGQNLSITLYVPKKPNPHQSNPYQYSQYRYQRDAGSMLFAVQGLRGVQELVEKAFPAHKGEVVVANEDVPSSTPGIDQTPITLAFTPRSTTEKPKLSVDTEYRAAADETSYIKSVRTNLIASANTLNVTEIIILAQRLIQAAGENAKPTIEKVIRILDEKRAYGTTDVLKTMLRDTTSWYARPAPQPKPPVDIEVDDTQSLLRVENELRAAGRTVLTGKKKIAALRSYADIMHIGVDQVLKDADLYVVYRQPNNPVVVSTVKAVLDMYTKSAKSLVQSIADYTINYAPAAGPGSEKEREILAPGSSAVENIYKSIGLLSENKIEIFVPSSVGITETVQNTLSKIRQNKGKRSVVCRMFDSEKRLKEMLATKAEDGVKRIVVSDNIATKKAINNLVEADPRIFTGVRLLSIVLPEGYGELNRQFQSVYQADIITRAILVRLLEKDGNPFVRSLLKSLIDDRIEGEMVPDADAFIDNLIESENEARDPEAVLKRIRYCLDTMVNLVEKIGEQLIILRHFVWTAA
jgi:enamine deaminase RidA (YjgF/YER057c/UK114 family)/tRNA A-37 threonylcarbamoyl transferase component Bud32